MGIENWKVARGLPENPSTIEAVYDLSASGSGQFRVSLKAANASIWGSKKRTFVARELEALKAFLEEQPDVEEGPASRVQFVMYSDGDAQTNFHTPQAGGLSKRELVKEALNRLPSIAIVDPALKETRRGNEMDLALG